MGNVAGYGKSTLPTTRTASGTGGWVPLSILDVGMEKRLQITRSQIAGGEEARVCDLQSCDLQPPNRSISKIEWNTPGGWVYHPSEAG